MSVLFDRTASLQFGNLLIEHKGGLDLGLDFRFSVNKSLKKQPNTARIEIMNLNKDRRGTLETAKEIPIQLSAGYRGENTLIFSGDLYSCYSERDGPDIITTIESGDGGKKYKNRTKVSYGPNIKVQRVIEKLAKDLGVGVGNLEQATTNLRLERLGDTYPKGYAFAGRAESALDSVCQSTGLEYSIQDGNLQFLKVDEPLSNAATVLSYDSGLLSVKSKSSDKIVRASTLLLPDLFPGRKVDIQTEEVEGFFRVVTTHCTGYTQGGEWGFDIECAELK